ncbi:MAG TPA: FHA domain-containing protein [Candidatus Binataceae bacterium]|nr:FHA domain-containing protein [Candidatus Binataceae bacterium]
MIKCSECGYENMDGLDYCDGCGAKLESPSHSAPAGQAAHGAAPSSSTSADPEPAAVNEMAAEGAPATAAESPSTAATTPESPSPPSDAAAEGTATNEHIAAVPEPPSAKAPTGEMNAAAAAPVSAPEPAPAPFKAKLSIIRGGRRGQEFELESGNNLVGRWDPETGAFPEVDLDADDPEAKVSRKHALIRIDAGKITIEDIGSLNGTYVNRQPRLQPGTPQDLKDGDEIIIGKTFLKLSVNPIS